jgi:RNA polymerase sigma factor (sigma-70 family)
LGILMNRCRKHIRAAVRRRRRERAAARRRAALDNGVATDDRLRAVQAALDQLSPQHRELVILRFHQGLDVEQTGRALGIPAGTVKSRCHAAIARLRQIVEAQE